jgi:hypothetical protein
MRRPVVALVIAVILVGKVHTSRAEPAPDAKRPEVALGLSISGAVIGTVIVATSRDRLSGDAWIGAGFLTIGPSFGQWYSGRFLTPGLGVRALGVIVAGAGAATDFFGCQDTSPSACADHAKANALLIAGGALVLGGTIWDIATAPSTARDWNREHGVTVTATAMPTAGGIAPGLAVVGTF